EILRKLAPHAEIEKLKFFRQLETKMAGIPVEITRTGYTGDLGYELWVRPEFAERLFDCLMDKGSGYGILPAGMVALDIARIEAGLLLIEVDYISSHYAVIEAQKSSPYELGLGWAVALDGANFIGRKALQTEKAAGSPWTFVGLHIDWPHLERLFAQEDLPPKVAGRAQRTAVPIYKNGRQIGQATSQTFAPILKQYIAIGTVETAHAAIGSQVQMEVTVEYSREKVNATIVNTPFYNPERKRK
ncbi:MAG: aminomethyltransferase family protein, partial [Anaerolineales bacterium]|nr:aminomethyltransferase family protein [Anaerolineales bacterium]